MLLSALGARATSSDVEARANSENDKKFAADEWIMPVPWRFRRGREEECELREINGCHRMRCECVPRCVCVRNAITKLFRLELCAHRYRAIRYAKRKYFLQVSKQPNAGNDKGQSELVGKRRNKWNGTNKIREMKMEIYFVIVAAGNE